MQLKPIKPDLKIEKQAERKILEFLFESIFEPVLVAMQESKETYFNSSSKIEEAIRKGKIQYSQGIIKGDFNAALSKEFRELGFKFDNRVKGYRKEINSLPVNLQVAIAQTASNYQKMSQSMLEAINNLHNNYQEVSFVSDYEEALTSINDDITKTVSDVIGIKTELTDIQRNKIAREYSNNLNLYIKNFFDEQIPLLRQDVERAVFEGIRAESLQKTIQQRFSVSESKAKFLAKQEISLLTSKFKQAKYQELGVNKYKWSSSQDSRTRPDHKELNGKIFSFDDPPIEDKSKGTKANPGEPFGCRCVAIPIID